MKEFFLTIAKYNEETNKAVAGILGKLSNDDREKNRKSYYGSLSGLYRHVAGCTVYFLSLFKEAVSGNAEAVKAIESVAKVEIPKGKLSEEQWKELLAASKKVDKAFVNFVAAITDKDCEAPVKIDWFKGKPAAVPLRFMLQNHTVHNTHHRGQISQILDSLKIDNDYSGISPKFI